MKEGWKYCRLGEVCTTTSGGTPSKAHPEYYEKGVIPWLRSGEVRYGDIFDAEIYITEEALANTSAKILPKGTVLIAMYGATVGQVGILRQPMCTNQAICGILPCDIIKPEFLRYAIIANKNRYLEQAVGGAQPNISQQIVRNTTIPDIPLEQQQQIVAELDLLSGIIEKQKRQLKELDTLAQSIFYDMFGDPVENEMGWKIKPLEEIVSEDCTISYGIVQPGEGVKNGIPVVRPVDMTDTFVRRKGLKQTTKEISDSYKRTVLEGNEILLCVRGTTGMVSLATNELIGCNVTRGISPIKCNDLNDRWFIYYQFKSPHVQQYIKDCTKGITLKQINMTDVRKTPFMTPPLPLQQEFARKIESIEHQNETISKSIGETQRLFDYTMDKYFG